MFLGVVPRPKKPKNFDSFLWPFIQEMLQLVSGIVAFDILKEEMFMLYAFLIIVLGDIPAISMRMQMKGHNRISPCHMCKILAIQNPPKKVHYVPHDCTNFPPPLREALASRHPHPRDIPLLFFH
ncbi:hypothetical protein V5O48_015294 [Marasmius crinis-equi]|uniref:Uncharacterized protein n=1 Tax=Marasmius crinis-equi TaxID=585013 RepID=A0ABR3EV79_9AGAR